MEWAAQQNPLRREPSEQQGQVCLQLCEGPAAAAANARLIPEYMLFACFDADSSCSSSAGAAAAAAAGAAVAAAASSGSTGGGAAAAGVVIKAAEQPPPPRRAACCLLQVTKPAALSRNGSPIDLLDMWVQEDGAVCALLAQVGAK